MMMMVVMVMTIMMVVMMMMVMMIGIVKTGNRKQYVSHHNRINDDAGVTGVEDYDD